MISKRKLTNLEQDDIQAIYDCCNRHENKFKTNPIDALYKLNIELQQMSLEVFKGKHVAKLSTDGTIGKIIVDVYYDNDIAVSFDCIMDGTPKVTPAQKPNTIKYDEIMAGAKAYLKAFDKAAHGTWSTWQVKLGNICRDLNNHDGIVTVKWSHNKMNVNNILFDITMAGFEERCLSININVLEGLLFYKTADVVSEHVRRVLHENLQSLEDFELRTDILKLAQAKFSSFDHNIAVLDKGNYFQATGEVGTMDGTRLNINYIFEIVL